ncbi:MAG: MFS transporter [Intrasporangium sp.]|uniref:MFS transporter n=1 Tax=Intrasporangium sp. TaxID=1925024 RepID=UPI002649118A|nr:MFS transporter [Intrasporangium sp.]MDN5795521.1 MFS transporter [Intrasporangium sp.]
MPSWRPGRARLAILTHAFLLQLAAYIVRPASAYRAMELGVDPGLVGLIAASFALVPLLVAVFVGRWADRGRAWAALLLGAVVMVGAGAGLVFAAGSLGALLSWNAVIGLGHLLSVLGEQTMVAAAGRERRDGLDSAFGTFTFAGSLGQAAAPLILAGIGGGAVLPDTRPLMLAYTAACIGLLGVTFVLRRKGSHGADAEAPRPGWAALRVPAGTKRTMAGAILLSMFVLAAVDLIQVYLPALGVERQLPSWLIGVLLTVRAGATMVSRLGLARLTSRMGRNRLVVGSTLAAGGAVGLVAVPMHPVLLGGCLVVGGFALGVGQPLSMSIVTLAAPAGTTSTWLALRLSGNRLGQSAIPAILSAATASVGTSGIFVVTGVGLLGTAAVARALIPDDRG